MGNVSRRSLLASGGALVVAFTGQAAGCGTGHGDGRASAG